MPTLSALERATKRTDDLIVSFGRGDDISRELEPVFDDIASLFTELCSDLRGLSDNPDDPESLAVNTIIADLAEHASGYYRNWFDTYASLVHRQSRSGRYPRMAHDCLVIAFKALHDFAGDDMSIVKTAVIADWQERIATS